MSLGSSFVVFAIASSRGEVPAPSSRVRLELRKPKGLLHTGQHIAAKESPPGNLERRDFHVPHHIAETKLG
ncbi:hypothetical protein NL676_002741 [Syzygium grande]|nr:hypothetical protein NL676_002741 [Syzygium grande]